jgi:DNA-binding CsgD family transcriptional regulator
MYKLDSRSSRTLLSALEILNSDHDPKTLPKRAVDAAALIVKADWLTFDFFSGVDKYENTAWSNSPTLLSPVTLEPFGRYLHQHPIVNIALSNQNGAALKITDATSQKNFEKTDLYNEFYRKLSIDRQMGLAVLSEGDLTMTYAFARKGKDFTDKEKAIASVAAPHFMNAIRNGFNFQRMNRALAGGGLGVIAMNRSGKAKFISEFAKELISRYFPNDTIIDGEIPESLKVWFRITSAQLKSGDLLLPESPLRMETDGGVLTLRLLESRSNYEELILLEERRELDLHSLLHLPVTKREAFFFFCIIKVKSDPEIAMLLGISVRTVQKHLEHLFTKLGVESRFSAATVATDAIGTIV